MKIDRLNITNFRGISEIGLNLDPSLNIFVGINGSGKSSILEALANLLSWLTRRIRRPNANGRPIEEIDIRNKESYSLLKIAVSHQGELITWAVAKTRKARTKKDISSDYRDLNRLIEKTQKKIEETNEQCSIPLPVFYPVNRVIIDIPLRIRKAHDFSLLEAYENSLTSAANFRTFFEWFRNREDLENENRKYENSLFRPEGWQFPDRQLEAVRQALKKLMPEFSDFSVRRNPLRMVVHKNGQELIVNQLSDGEKVLFGMVGDLARRLAIANPSLDNPLKGKGIVLIDEIELHLHPRWQRRIVPKLVETFPNCQFVVTTHSPQVISEAAPENVWRLYPDKDTQTVRYHQPKQTFGLESGEILEEVMDAGRRNREVNRRISHIFSLIDDESFEQAKDEIQILKKKIHGNIPDLVRAETMITMLEGKDW